VLVDVVGYEAMQRLADELGLKIMQFGRKMFEAATPPEKENYITAEDSIQLLKAIYDGSFLSDESRQTIIDWMSAQTVKTKIGAGVPEGTPIAHKTGENASVTHDLGYLLWPGNEIALAIFAQSESTDDFDTVQATVNPVVAEMAGIIYRHLNASAQE
jgi:beta-lactamase class A